MPKPRLSLYDLMKLRSTQPRMHDNTNVPLAEMQQDPIQSTVPAPQTQGYQRPVIDPQLEQASTEQLKPKKGFLAKYGFTPGVLTQIASGVTALTGGDPFLASGLAQAGGQMVGQEATAETQRQARLADYVKGIRQEQKEFDIRKFEKEENQKAKEEERAFKMQQEQIAKKEARIANIEKQKQIEAETKGIPDEIFNREKALRTEYVRNLGSFPDVVESYGRIQASVDEPSAAGDLALIFNYMKMLDPGSVVRESEFANAAATGSFGERFIAAGKKIIKGERLSPEMRKDFINRANKLYKSQEEISNKMQERYKEKIGLYGLDPERTLIDFRYTGKLVDPEKVQSLPKKRRMQTKNDYAPRITKQDQDLLSKYGL